MPQPRRASLKAQSRTDSQSEIPPTNLVRIVVADGEMLGRMGLAGILESRVDFEVLCRTGTLEETIEQCRISRPDVLVLSLDLPGEDRIEALPAIRRANPSLRIVALSARATEHCLVLNPPSRREGALDLGASCESGIDCLQLAMTQGAMATLRRSCSPGELFEAIRHVAEGHSWHAHTTTMGTTAATGGEPNHAHRTSSALSARELEVAAMIAEAHSNKEISAALHISEPTVKKHVGHILAKFGLSDRLQLGVFLVRNPQYFR